jgi:hypothetical protein
VSNTCPIPLPSSVLVAADQQLRVVTNALGCPRAGASGDGHADNSLDGHANPLTRARRPRPRRRPDDPDDSALDGHADAPTPPTASSTATPTNDDPTDRRRPDDPADSALNGYADDRRHRQRRRPRR